MYDDGYNRKKSKKRKKKQSGGNKEKKQKIESKSKKDAAKINAQIADVNIKIEIKTEDTGTNAFEYVAQESIEEIPVLQGSYNDKIIIEDDPVDPLKIDNPADNFNPPEIVEKYAKRKRKHSKHSEQKKSKPKHVSKSKRKRDNVSLFNNTLTLNVPNATVQCKNMSQSDIETYLKNISNQEKINICPRVALTDEFRKKTTKNITNTGQTNLASNDDKKDMAKLTNSAVENKATISSSINNRSDSLKMLITTSTNSGKSYCAIVHNNSNNTNSGCQNESTRTVAAPQINQSVNANYESMGAENRSIKNSRKDLIKAPRFSLPSDISANKVSKPQAENSAGNQPILHSMSKIFGESSTTSNLLLIQHSNPPVLENELEAQYIENNSAVSTPPSLEKTSLRLPADTAITRMLNKDYFPIFPSALPQFNSYSTNYNIGMRPIEKMLCTSGSKEFRQTYWQNNAYSIASQAGPTATIGTQDILNPNKKFTSDLYSKIYRQTYPPAQITPIADGSKIAMQNTEVSTTTNVLSASASRSKQTMAKITKTASRQRSQKGTSRRKPLAKNNKSNNNESSSTSQASTMDISVENTTGISIGNTTDIPVGNAMSVGTQLDVPIDTRVLVSDSNVPSRITSTQDTSHENKHLSISNKKLQNLQKQTDNSLHLPMPKTKQLKTPVSRRKPKEKKATTRRKQPMTIIPANIDFATIDSATIAPMINTTVPPATISTTATPMIVAMEVAPATAIPAATTFVTVIPTAATSAAATPAAATTAVVTTMTPATGAPVIETTKDQSTSTQSADMPQLCSTQSTIIPGHISVMIYPNVPNSELLKAFNDYWSAQVSHCAICATFASCTSGSSRMMPPDWKYCKSTMLPESTPIWVRK